MPNGMTDYQKAVRYLDEQIERLQSLIPEDPNKIVERSQKLILQDIYQLSLVRQAMQSIKEENCELRNMIRTNVHGQESRGAHAVYYS